ncbi:flavin reductase family protein [Streptomyces sp. NPDC052396]|uniref:flavin reductase family protein n=1 Tax=Streptomyces sp. NPDC052396 TaxID=3365689 RepID=UPI0037D21C1A
MDGRLFRDFFGSFPTAVAVVTAVDADGRPRGMTCSALSAVSAEPPLLLVCLNRGSQTLEAIQTSGAFALNLLGADGEAPAKVFAGSSDDKFAGVRWRPAPQAGGAPVLLDVAYAHAECSVVRTVEAGDHLVVIGRMDACAVRAEPPVLHQRGSFWPWAPERVSAQAGQAHS